MANKSKFQAIKGTRDLLPPETELWNRVEQTAREVFGTFGFGEIRLPIFEPTELFARAVGGETDIVSKEMYSFEDHDHRDLAIMRTAMQLQLSDHSDPSVRNIIWFFQQVPVYSDCFSSLFNKAQVPRTPENEWVQRRFSQLAQEAILQLPKIREFEHIRGRENEKLIAENQLSKEFAEFKVWYDQLIEVLQTVKLGDEVSLRPEATASVCRAYIEHGMHALPQPVKLFYYAQCSVASARKKVVTVSSTKSARKS